MGVNLNFACIHHLGSRSLIGVEAKRKPVGGRVYGRPLTFAAMHLSGFYFGDKAAQTKNKFETLS